MGEVDEFLRIEGNSVTQFKGLEFDHRRGTAPHACREANRIRGRGRYGRVQGRCRFAAHPVDRVTDDASFFNEKPASVCGVTATPDLCFTLRSLAGR